ncbi:hypothetical protein SCLCIDRAFT_854717 [Scleroderma citrinum Foug A]|uniref:Uncharacterized protein n=1 Tax=Scleroderma citrinum Foug A TaxID=1036808 RepID=A0A0C3AAQ5_9AGAM|nr:hypothetical protein SCLCIDRAFT_854717 [Scleroderma citrinum Foug A]
MDPYSYPYSIRVWAHGQRENAERGGSRSSDTMHFESTSRPYPSQTRDKTRHRKFTKTC